MTEQNVPAEARKLNMEEKRKLEKLLLSDVDATIAAYHTKRALKLDAVEEAAVAAAPSEAKSLLALYLKSQIQSRKALKDLEEIGYSVSSYGSNVNKLEIHHSTKPKTVRDFVAQTTKTEKALAELKRTYTLKLFAGGEEAKELFAALGQELERIVN